MISDHASWPAFVWLLQESFGEPRLREWGDKRNDVKFAVDERRKCISLGLARS